MSDRIFANNPKHLGEIEQTEEICLEAMTQSPLCYDYIENKTPSINKRFVELYPRKIGSVQFNSPEEMTELSKYVTDLCWLNLCYIDEQNEDICRHAFNKDARSYGHIKDKRLRKELACEAVSRWPINVRSVPDCSRELLDYAMYLDPTTISEDEVQDEPTCWKVLLKDPANIEHIEYYNITKAMTKYCFNADPELIKYVPTAHITYKMAVKAMKVCDDILSILPDGMFDDNLFEIFIRRDPENVAHIPINLLTKERLEISLRVSNELKQQV